MKCLYIRSLGFGLSVTWLILRDPMRGMRRAGAMARLVRMTRRKLELLRELKGARH